MDGETEGYLGGIFGDVSPSVPLMPIDDPCSAPSQIALTASGAAPRALEGGSIA